jgi:hypothetical protein
MPFIWFLRINRYSTPTIWILVKQLTHCWWDKCILYSIFDIPSYLSLLKIGPVFFQRIYTCDKVKREWDCTTNTSGPHFEITGFDLIWFIVLNTTFSNISAISWRPVLVVDEAGVPGENHRPWASNWQTLSLVSRAHLFCNVQSRVGTHVVLVIGLYGDKRKFSQ